MSGPANQPTAESRQHERRDSEDDYAEWIDFLSGISNIVIGGFTVALFYAARVANETSHKAFTASEQANELATKALNLASETAVHQLRAYVFLEWGEMFHEGKQMRFAAKLKNFGQTPARDIRIRTVAVIEGHTDADAKDLTADLPPGGDIVIQQWYSPVLSPAGMVRIHKGVVTVEVRMDYTDSFGNPRWTTAGYKSHKFVGENKIAFARADGGNDFA